MSEMKICVECEHCTPRPLKEAECARTRRTDVVTGEWSYLSCRIARSDVGLCSQSGAWWEAKCST